MFRSFSKLARRNHGFSMAEVVVALFLFTASVLGISVMMVSGGANITLGSQDTTAQNLASKKIEEVKSLPFYTPYSAAVGKRDIDDWFWDAGNYVSGSTPGLNANQLGNPAVEDYGTIPGYPKYKRTTAVQYQYVNSGALTPAVMNSGWVPNGATGTQSDKPKGGSGASVTDDIHGCLIEVKVYFQSDSGTRSYMEHGLAGDLMVTGGTNNPIMVVTGIYCDPHVEEQLTPPPPIAHNEQASYYGASNVLMKIFVQANGLVPGTSSMEVKLWYPGTNDVASIDTATVVSTSEIDCHFTLDAAHGIRIGKYNLSVYWRDKGWLDKSYREGFEVVGAGATITSVSNYNWGYRKQGARQVTITGDNLTGCSVAMKGPHPTNNYTISGSVNVGLSNQTTLVATFPLTGDGTTRPNNSYWDFEVTTVNGRVTSTASDGDNSRRFWMNPPPQVTGVSATSDPSYYDWAYRGLNSRNIRITGNYLYALNDYTDSGVYLKYGAYATPKATYVSGPAGDNANSTDPIIMNFNPRATTPNNSFPNGQTWNVQVDTCAGSNTMNSLVKMNPQPTLSTVSGLGSYTGTQGGSTFSGISLSGSYLQNVNDSGTSTNPIVYMVQCGGAIPAANQPVGTCNGGAVNTAGTADTGMTMSVVVQPMSFRKWVVGGTPAGTPTDAEIAPSGAAPNKYGTYYAYVKNPDTQYSSNVSSNYANITHKQWAISADVTPAGWGSITFTPAEPADGYWQDTPYTLSPVYTMPYAIRTWQEPVGTDQWGTLGYGNISGTATVARSLRCRSLKYLYYGPNGSSGNYALFHQGNAWSDGSGAGYDAPNYQYADNSDAPGSPWPNSVYVMRVHSWGKVNTFNSKDAEVDSETNGLYNCAGATKIWIRWKQPNGNGDGSNSNSGFSASGNHNGAYNDGRVAGGDDVQFGWTWNSANCTGWNPYIRVGAKSDAVWPMSSPDTDIRVSIIFITNE